MRTIKYRGYNRKNKQWLYGFYLQNRGAHFVCPDEFATGKTWEDYEVDPDTVGQFTGLLDKNGKEIYEGDIVQCGDFVYQVVYEGKRYASFGLRRSKDLFMHYFGEAMEASECTVIGNIHDNPELLKQITNQTN